LQNLLEIDTTGMKEETVGALNKIIEFKKKILLELNLTMDVTFSVIDCDVWENFDISGQA
jgi:hypothetical protein